jgi:hypothetical protein
MVQNSSHKLIGLVCLWIFFSISCNLFTLPEKPSPSAPPSATLSPSDTPIDTPTIFPTDTPTPPLSSQETGEPVVSLVLYPVEGGAAYTGRQLQVVLEAIPERIIITQKSDGSVESVSTAWTDFTVSEMQYCFSFDEPCMLSEAWAPFTLSPDSVYLGGSAQQKYSFTVDWVGPRILYAVAQFRNANKDPVLAFASTFASNKPVVTGQISMQIEGVWNEATPVLDQPGPVQTAIAATKAAFPVTGSVVLNGGASATGGIAGETIQVQAAFTGTSPYGAVTQMRAKQTGTCRTDQIQMDDAQWEPFTTARSFPVALAINWIGFYVAAQYRDEKGNLSQVYCDDISVEGMPPTPVTTP